MGWPSFSGSLQLAGHVTVMKRVQSCRGVLSLETVQGDSHAFRFICSVSKAPSQRAGFTATESSSLAQGMKQAETSNDCETQT